MLGQMKRRHLLGALAALPASLGAQATGIPLQIGPRALVFPADFGAHPGARTEWWYLTGALQAGEHLFGFQLTFFRSRTGLAADHASRFAAQQLVFAHAALSDVKAARMRHDQRIARAGFGIAEAAEGDTQVVLRDWSLKREGAAGASRYLAQAGSDSAGFRLALTLATTQPVLLQGEAGLSRKAPQPEVVSHYYSQPQLAASGTLTLDGRALPVQGRAWLDHEWSNTLLAPQAVGWDWVGMNLDDGSALTAFRLRRADGSTLYAGGSLRAPGGAVRNFQPGEVNFSPGRSWLSPVSQARYPVQWTVQTPAGHHAVNALFDAQELDSRHSTGAFYWEGLSELRNDTGQRIGRGYLEMTGYADALRL
ncbi:MAG: carotenoid 1,2-hydratase [Cytophagales bacterium]|nr:carotenoid 1,2-hydratase [Rhizobacter sp.]